MASPGLTTFAAEIGDGALQERLGRVLNAIERVSSRCTIVLVARLIDGPITDLDESGVVHTAQSYTEQQVDKIIRSYQSIGFHVLSFFSERDFMRATIDGSLLDDSKEIVVVYSAVEGGTGPGRRALIPAFCNLFQLPICHSGPHGASLARHKYHANAVMAHLGYRVPETWLYDHARGWLGGRRPSRGRRVIMKPTYESMAIGVNDTSVCIVTDTFDSTVASRAAELAQPLIVQDFVSGFEIAVPLLEIQRVEALPIVGFSRGAERRFGSAPRTFIDETTPGRVGHFEFTDVPITQYRAIQEEAVSAFIALGMKHSARIDMRVDEDGRHWIFDTNESPPPLGETSYAFSLGTLGFTVGDMLALWVAGPLHHAGVIDEAL